MATCSIIVFSLWVTFALGYPAHPFPVVRRASAYPMMRRSGLYGQETYSDRTMYGVPATRSESGMPRASWPFLNDYVMSRAPQPSIPVAPVAYGAPGDSIWTDALLRFDESTGRMTENKPQEVVAQLLRRQEPYAEVVRPASNLDYGLEEEDDYESNSDFVPEISQPELSPEILGYGNFQNFQAAPEEEAPLYDSLRIMPQPVSVQVPDDSNAYYRESILPYLFMSALENDEVTRNRLQSVSSSLPESSQFGEIKIDIQAPPELTKEKSNRINEIPPVSASLPVLLENSKRTLPVSERSTKSVAPTQPPATKVQTTEATTTAIPTTQAPLLVKSQFHRGQEEVAMLRPPSDNHRYSKGLSALSWPKELEEDDTEEQKRQLRELPMEVGNLKSSDSMAPIAHSARKWPAALDEVDDWLADQLDQLKAKSQR